MTFEDAYLLPIDLLLLCRGFLVNGDEQGLKRLSLLITLLPLYKACSTCYLYTTMTFVILLPSGGRCKRPELWQKIYNYEGHSETADRFTFCMTVELMCTLQN